MRLSCVVRCWWITASQDFASEIVASRIVVRQSSHVHTGLGTTIWQSIRSVSCTRYLNQSLWWGRLTLKFEWLSTNPIGLPPVASHGQNAAQKGSPVAARVITRSRAVHVNAILPFGWCKHSECKLIIHMRVVWIYDYLLFAQLTLITWAAYTFLMN
jgi:hypothetical protein